MTSYQLRKAGQVRDTHERMAPCTSEAVRWTRATCEETLDRFGSIRPSNELFGEKISSRL